MRKALWLFGFILVILCSCTPRPDQKQKAGEVSVWMTTADKTSLFAEATQKLSFVELADTAASIEVDTAQQFQTVDGFGYALTGGSART